MLKNIQHQQTLIKIIFTVLVCSYLLTLHLSPYLLKPLVKAGPIYILILLVMTQINSSKKYFYLAALAASSIGDIFLATSIEYSFVLGLASFLVAHLFYCFVFIKSKSHNNKNAINTFIIGLIISFSILMAIYLLPATGDLLIPVTVYLCVISVMAIVAFKKNMHKLTLLGVISFLLSDSALALSIFKTPLPFSEYLVMTTYYLAQFLIVCGAISAEKPLTIKETIK